MKDLPPSSCPITPLPDHIGPYKIVRKIASGGMGEVFLAEDPFCKRTIALKRIRGDKIDHPGFKERFLKEAKIAAQLSHPSIIPIHQIHQIGEDIYYTMPLAPGETLKEILKKSLSQEKQGKVEHPIGASIPSLMRIFLSICQAIAYCHSKGVLHRDLKPENIIIGPYGEVLILDWGLANFISSQQEEILEDSVEGDAELTKPGKIAGTLSYLPPERILGVKASYSTDIYALGVILYQLLTLRLPFHRKTVKEYKRQIKHEALIEPSERAPNRDIPVQLSKIAVKCLSRHPERRYKTVEEILIDLNNYIEGHAEWVPYTSVQVEKKEDWKFQENVLLAKHIALTQRSDVMEWVSLMITKDSFPSKVRLETHIRIKEGGSGIGFLLNLRPQEKEKNFFQEGFFLWIGSESTPGCHLFRSNIEVMTNPDLYFKNQLSHFIRIEKTDHHIRLYFDGVLAFDYLSHTPLSGSLFGVVLKDADLEIGTILVSSSSPNIQINCLAVPDTLLTLRHFTEALSRYRQIASSFAGRTEGNEALFRAGITLLEEAQHKKGHRQKELILESALKEFDKFKAGAGSPLEYLGKSLVYKATKELQEELKCLELALYKFAKHPLIHLVKDQVLFRLHEASYRDKKETYEFASLTLRQIPEAIGKQDHRKLLDYLQKNCEPLPFLPKVSDHAHLEIQLAFSLAKPHVLLQIYQLGKSPEIALSALYALLYLGYSEKVLSLPLPPELEPIVDFYKFGFEKSMQNHFSSAKELLSFEKRRALEFLLSRFPFVDHASKLSMVYKLQKLTQEDLSFEERLSLQKHYICFLFHLGRPKEASDALENVPDFLRKQETSPFYFLEGCRIAAEHPLSEALKHLSGTSESFSPSGTSLLDEYLSSPSLRKKRLKTAFFWEKIQLLEQLSTLYAAAHLPAKQRRIETQIRQEFSDLTPL